jgi:hypothetical protein
MERAILPDQSYEYQFRKFVDFADKKNAGLLLRLDEWIPAFIDQKCLFTFDAGGTGSTGLLLSFVAGPGKLVRNSQFQTHLHDLGLGQVHERCLQLYRVPGRSQPDGRLQCFHELRPAVGIYRRIILMGSVKYLRNLVRFGVTGRNCEHDHIAIGHNGLSGSLFRVVAAWHILSAEKGAVA